MQNLNLYQVERQQRSGPQRLHMLALLGALLLGCALHAGWQFWQLRDAGQRLVAAEASAQEQDARLAAAKASFVEPQLDGSLPGELTAREADNRELQRLIGYLQVLAGQQRAGFVAPLTALAEQHPPHDLWLSHIQLSDGGSQMRLQGSSREQELLPQYLQRLGQSPVFKGREFARFDITRGEDQLLRFDLSSRSAAQEKDHE